MRSLVSIDDGEDTKSAHDSEIAPLIGQVRLAMTVEIEQEFLQCQELAGLEITAAQFGILRIVSRGGAESACDLCHVMNYDRGAMSRMIDRLETKALLRRVPLAHTRRSVALEVTAAGKTALPVMEACLDRVMGRMLKGITKTQIRETQKVLKQMLENV